MISILAVCLINRILSFLNLEFSPIFLGYILQPIQVLAAKDAQNQRYLTAVDLIFKSASIIICGSARFL